MTKGKAAILLQIFQHFMLILILRNMCFCVLEKLEFIMRGKPFPSWFHLDIDKKVLTSKLKTYCILFCHEMPYLSPLISIRHT